MQGCIITLIFTSETVEVQGEDATCPRPHSKGGDGAQNPGVRPPRKGLLTRPELPQRAPETPSQPVLPPHPSPGMSMGLLAMWPLSSY